MVTLKYKSDQVSQLLVVIGDFIQHILSQQLTSFASLGRDGFQAYIEASTCNLGPEAISGGRLQSFGFLRFNLNIRTICNGMSVCECKIQK
jgi:hypothetical protein